MGCPDGIPFFAPINRRRQNYATCPARGMMLLNFDTTQERIDMPLCSLFYSAGLLLMLMTPLRIFQVRL